MSDIVFLIALAVCGAAVVALAALLVAARRSAGSLARRNQELTLQAEAERKIAASEQANLKSRLEEREDSFNKFIALKDSEHAKALAAKDAEHDKALAAREAAHANALAAKDAEHEKALAAREAAHAKLLAERGKAFDAAVSALKEQFTNLAAEKLKASADGLSTLNQRRLSEIIAPFKEQMEKFRSAFEENREQQIKNSAQFGQAIADLGDRAMKIGKEAEALAKALKSESKTQGDWGEMVLANILSAAGLKEGIDFLPQQQETDENGERLIPDVRIPLPNKETLLIDSKASVTAYLNYVAAADEAGRAQAAKEHVASVRKHIDELADKNYIKKIKGSQGYILMFIPNEGSYLLAMEQDRRLATDAFKRHVIIVNPTTLLLCLQIVALLRSREAVNENAERIAAAAAKMYDKFATFLEGFLEIGRKIGGLSDAFTKARGQLDDGNASFRKQLDALKDMGLVTNKTLKES